MGAMKNLSLELQEQTPDYSDYEADELEAQWKEISLRASLEEPPKGAPRIG